MLNETIKDFLHNLIFFIHLPSICLDKLFAMGVSYEF